MLWQAAPEVKAFVLLERFPGSFLQEAESHCENYILPVEPGLNKVVFSLPTLLSYSLALLC